MYLFWPVCFVCYFSHVSLVWDNSREGNATVITVICNQTRFSPKNIRFYFDFLFGCLFLLLLRRNVCLFSWITAHRQIVIFGTLFVEKFTWACRLVDSIPLSFAISQSIYRHRTAITKVLLEWNIFFFFIGISEAVILVSIRLFVVVGLFRCIIV